MSTGNPMSNPSTPPAPAAVAKAEVQRYLGQLAAAGAGARPGLDAAVLHDMMADAEDHLLAAVGSGKSAAEAIAEFGEPAEIIAAYQQSVAGAGAWAGQQALKPVGQLFTDPWRGDSLPALLPRSKLAAIPVVGVWFMPMAWRAVAFLILGLIPATVYFAVMVTGVSLSLGLLPMLIGPLVLVGVLGLARGMSLAHGRMIELMLGVRMPRRQAAVATAGTNRFVARMWLWLKDVRSWLSAAFLVGNFPVALALFVVVVSLMSTGLALLLAPIVHGVFGQPLFVHSTGGGIHLFGKLYEPDPVTGQIDVPVWAQVFISVVGFALVTTTLWVSLGAAYVYANVAKAIQVSRPVV